VNWQKWIIAAAYQLKFVLFHILPISWLRKVKEKMIQNNFQRLHKLQLKSYERGYYPAGVNLIGSIRAETGLGQSCRLLANELKHCSFPVKIINYIQVGNLSQKDTSWDQEIEKECCYSINVVHINPHELGTAMIQLDREIWDRRYNIGFWLWELEEFPEQWLPCLEYMDEIWTPSEFISCAIRKKTEKPVWTIPYAIEAEPISECGRSEFGLPNDQFLFLILYDNNSITERKNPQGAITAFRMAFSKQEENVGLVIKINTPDKKELKQLRNQLDGYKNIYFIVKTLEKKKVNSLIACVDVVVSLHRAEGFGLVLAEAMFLGTPTIATNWSSNIEFMNSNIACMVDYSLVEIQEDRGPFKRGQHWAEADLNQAAEYMKKLYKDENYREQISKKAKDYIMEKLGMKQATKRIEARIKSILYQ